MLRSRPRRRTPVLIPPLLICVLLGPGIRPGIGPARAQQASTPGAQADDRPADRAAIRAAMQSFVKAFEARDSKAVAAHWTAEGEFTNEAGVTVRGRESLLNGFSAVFAGTPELKAQTEAESLRFLSKDTAVENGVVKVRRGSAESMTRVRYEALYVREDGRWLFARLTESPGDDASVEDLGWLVGEWKSTAGQGAEIHTTYTWAPGKKFLHAQFAISEKALSLGGTQVIGVDPATKILHTWTFEADGGVGEANWSSDGDHWVLETVGTLADGRTLTETNILRRVNDNTFTWQSIDRLLEDEPLADLAPVKVTRIKPVP
jgi:uncharacterized protein (TIGR02246 family)